MSTSNMVAFPKEKQQTQFSVLQKAKKVYDEALQEYREQCRIFAICRNLRATVHHQRMVEASDIYLTNLKDEIKKEKDFVLKGGVMKIFNLVSMVREYTTVSKRRSGAQTMANQS